MIKKQFDVVITQEDVIDYLNGGLSSQEYNEIAETLGYGNIYENFFKVDVKTLSEEYQMDLLLKLYKEASSIEELENMIKPEYLEKVRYSLL